MPDREQLIERLRLQAAGKDHRVWGLLTQAADLLEADERERERLREALERIVDPENFYDGPADEMARLDWVGRVAHAALNPSEEQPSA